MIEEALDDEHITDRVQGKNRKIMTSTSHDDNKKLIYTMYKEVKSRADGSSSSTRVGLCLILCLN